MRFLAMKLQSQHFNVEMKYIVSILSVHQKQQQPSSDQIQLFVLIKGDHDNIRSGIPEETGGDQEVRSVQDQHGAAEETRYHKTGSVPCHQNS